MGLKQIVVKGFLWVSLGVLAVNVIQFFVRIILARLLAPDDFGVVALAITIVGFINSFQDLGLGTALVQRQKSVEESFNAVFTFVLIVSVLFTVLSIGLLSPLAAFFNDDRLKDVFFFVALTIPSAIIIVPYFSYISKHLLFFRRFLAETIPVIIGQGVSLILALFGFGYKSLVFGYVAGSVSLVAVLLVLTPWRPKLVFDLSVFRELFGYSKFIFFSNILAIVLAQGNNLVLGRMLTTEDVGFYAMAFALATLPAVNIAHALSKVVFPAFAKLQDDAVGLVHSFVKSARAMSAIVFPITGGLIVISPIFFSVVLGEKWSPALVPFMILSVVALFKSLSVVPSYFLQGTGAANIDLRIIGSGMAVFFGLIIPLVYLYNVVGASLAIMFAYFVMIVYYAVVSRRILNLKYQEVWLFLAPPLTATFFMVFIGGVLSVVLNKTMVGLFSTVIACSVVYAIALFKLDKELVGDLRDVVTSFLNANK